MDFCWNGVIFLLKDFDESPEGRAGHSIQLVDNVEELASSKWPNLTGWILP